MTTRNDQLQQVLDDCLDHVLREGDSVEACLSRYPEHSAELEPLLRLALDTRQTLAFTPSGAAKDRARMTLQESIRQHEARRHRRRPWHLVRGFSGRLTGPYRWAASAAAALLLVVVGGTGIVAASSNSLPDQPLYPVKRTVERARLTFTFSGHAKAQLYAAFTDRRVDEMAIMATKGSQKHVERLAADMDRNLRQIQRTAVPVVMLPVFALTVVPGSMPPSKEYILLVVEPPQLSPTARNHMRALHRRLKQDLQHQERLLLPEQQRAPGPARDELRKALRATTIKYRALIQTIAILAEEESAEGGP